MAKKETERDSVRERGGSERKRVIENEREREKGTQRRRDRRNS